MALHGVFANDLQFGKGVNSDQAQDDEREESEMDYADLEEGEIASDDDDETQQDDKKPEEDKVTAVKSEVKKEDFKTGTLHQSERPDSVGFKSSGITNEKRRDKRGPSNNSTSRTRKRAGEDDTPSHRDSHRKRRRTRDGDNDEIEEAEYDTMNVRGHSPMERLQRFGGTGESAGSDYDDNNMNSLRRQRGGEARSRPGRSSPPRRRPANGNRDRGSGDRRRQERDRSDRDRRPAKNNITGSSTSNKMKDESICAFYMEGKCSRGNDCPYSHAALPPRKMELCKFYLMDCCAKKEKCLYLHKDFPCKFFHTGKKCRHSAEECKFSHDSLSETMRAILIKHIETAPREILGDFPRLTREETIQAIDHFSPLPNGREKRPHIPALFNEQAGNTPLGLASKPDVKDTTKHQQPQDRNDDNTSTRRVGFYQDTGTSETEHGRGEQLEENSRSIWFGQLRQEMTNDRSSPQTLHEEHPKEKLEEATRFSPVAIKEEETKTVDYLSTLPARQRQLYRRIQQQQREPASTHEGVDPASQKNSLDDKWYSSDEEGNSESITDLLKSIKQKPEVQGDKDGSGPPLTNLNLNSLENINVAEIAKALSTLQQSQTSFTEGGPSLTADSSRRDPRTRDPRVRSSLVVTTGVGMGDVDLRVPTSSRQDVDLRLDSRIAADVDLRSGLGPLGNLDDIGSSDIDLRRLALPFKSTNVHTPTREIEASVNSRPLMEYQVCLVDCAPLDYSLIRVQADWAHLDPRQQKGIACVRDFTSTDHTPAIPLGPASPDPIPVAAPIRHYEPEPTSYSPLRSGPNDPRARDPRRPTVSQSQSTPTSILPEKRGISGVGLLGAAPPGMIPLLPKGSSIDVSSQETSYSSFRQMNYIDRSVIDEPHREQQSRQLENRRDPRQRHKNPPAITDSTEQSYTPPPNERVFR